MLKENFGNTQVIINLHMNKLFNLKAINHVQHLKSFYDIVQTNVRALEALGVPSSSFDITLAPLILSKLPSFVRRKFVQSVTDDKCLSLVELMNFLHKDILTNQRCDAILGNNISKYNQYVVNNQSYDSKSFTRTPNNNKIGHDHNRNNFKASNTNNYANNKNVYKPFNNQNKSSHSKDTKPIDFNNNSGSPVCAFCRDKHAAKYCTKFENPTDRIQKIKELKLCFRCLDSNHVSKVCNRFCYYCKDYHHISICHKLYHNNKIKSENAEAKVTTSTAVKTGSAVVNIAPAFLQTASMTALGLNGKHVAVNALFDGGSQVSFITESLCKQLGLRLHSSPMLSYNSFGSTSNSYSQTYKTKVKLKTCRGFIILPMLTIENIGGKFSQTCTNSMGPNLKGLNLQNANIDGSLDLLIGADNYWDCVTGEIINHSPGPVALGSIFGWLVSGKSNDPIENSKYRICMVMHPHDIMSEDQYNQEISNEWDHSIKEKFRRRSDLREFLQ